MTSHIIVVVDADLLYFMNGFVNVHANGLYIVPIMHPLGKSHTNSNAKNGGSS